MATATATGCSRKVTVWACIDTEEPSRPPSSFLSPLPAAVWRHRAWSTTPTARTRERPLDRCIRHLRLCMHWTQGGIVVAVDLLSGSERSKVQAPYIKPRSSLPTELQSRLAFSGHTLPLRNIVRSQTNPIHNSSILRYACRYIGSITTGDAVLCLTNHNFVKKYGGVKA
jgi:hypothetical protein